MTLWNELLEIPVSTLPCDVLLRLNQCPRQGSFDGTRTIATFDFSVTPELSHSFCDEWISGRQEMPVPFGAEQLRNQDMGGSTELATFHRPPRLHVSFSLNRDFVESCRRGLWPSSCSQGPHKDLISLAKRTVLPRLQKTNTAEDEAVCKRANSKELSLPSIFPIYPADSTPSGGNSQFQRANERLISEGLPGRQCRSRSPANDRTRQHTVSPAILPAAASPPEDAGAAQQCGAPPPLAGAPDAPAADRPRRGSPR